MVKLGRIPVPLLRRHDRAVNITVANLRAALQRRGDVLQERIPISNAQRPGGAEDGVVARAAQTWFVAERQPVVELELHPTTTARRSPVATIHTAGGPPHSGTRWLNMLRRPGRGRL
jgi:hypothetical protein